jgi:hypothetical protein
MAAGVIWLLLQKSRTPRLTHSIKSSIDEIHLKFGDVKEISLPKSG